jgi:ribosome biogenesis GTPase / thiamine phosphate phosphatase
VPREGIVLEAVGGIYRVRLMPRDGEIEAVLRGRLKKEARTGETVIAGDRVRLGVPDEGTPTIEEVLPRSSELVRARPGGRRPKRVASNVDRVLVVLAAADPPFRPDVADRFLVLAESCGIPPVLVVNKMDLVSGQEARAALQATLDIYRSLGYPVLETAALDGRGIEELRRLLDSGTSVLVGPSGVGKSSLLNALNPDFELRTREVSSRGRGGRHTTVSARLMPLAGEGWSGEGWVVDTPGFSDITLWGVDPALVPDTFPEFRERAGDCRFRGCRHLHEPGCAVKDALEAGEVDPGRYGSYRALMTEAEEAPSW